jgi:lipid-A-disaccharide synthase
MTKADQTHQSPQFVAELSPGGKLRSPVASVEPSAEARRAWRGNVCIVAAEASGDANAASLVRGLRETLGDGFHFWGVAGPKMRAALVEDIARVEDLSVMGFTELIAHYFRIRSIFAAIARAIEQRKPDLVILVDAPSFNLRLAQVAYETGAVVHFHIPPKAWAHGESRIEDMKRYLYSVTSVLPFEGVFFSERCLNVQFVGHPLKDEVEYYQKAHGSFMSGTSVRSGTLSIGLLPGSRVAEVQHHLPTLIKSLERLRLHFEKEDRKVIGLIPVADTLPEGWFHQELERALAGTTLPVTAVRVMRGGMYPVLSAVHYAWVCSGTAALESCFFEVPCSVFYHVSPISYRIAKKITRVSFISLINLVANREVVPEFIQSAFTADNLVQHALAVLEDPAQMAALKTELRQINRMFPSGCAAHAAQVIGELMDYWAPVPRESRRRWRMHHMGPVDEKR